MRKLCAIILLFTAIIAVAAPIDEAKKLYNAGDFEGAVKSLTQLRKKTPKDGTVNYYLGASLIALGRTDEAIAPLEVAEGRNVADASKILTTLALDAYDVDNAETHLDAWEKILSKNKKADLSEIEKLRYDLVMMRNMLERVERIEIIDSLNVDADDFFTHYRLSQEAGRLLSTTDPEVSVKARTLVYIPQNKREMIWAETDSIGNAVLVGSSILDDGTIDHPELLKGEFSSGGDADYPFLMSDGVTLYYAATGEGSLGGYDIFMTRRGDDGFLQPQNIGMPYNSPFNDYMFALDETTGAGWFASDRSQIEGKVTIYLFVASPTRVNYDSDDPTLAEKARITSIKDTQSDSNAARIVKQRVADIDDGTSENRTAFNFCISMGNGKVYTTLSDFKNVSARREMAKLLRGEGELEKLTLQLAELRQRYADGEKSLADKILDAEASLDFMRDSNVEQRNKVIRLETK